MSSNNSLRTSRQESMLNMSYLGRCSLSMALFICSSMLSTSTVVDAWTTSRAFQGHRQSQSPSPLSQPETRLFLNGIHSGMSQGIPHSTPSTTPPSIRSQAPGTFSHSTSSTATAASAAAAIPESASLSSAMFEQRMKQLVTSNRAPTAMITPRQPKKRLPSNVVIVNSMEEYKQVVGDEDQKVVAVRFHAHWCRACKLIEPLFYHMATRFPNVLFVDVPVTQQNSDLHQGLGIPSLPFGHLYHPNGGLVEELKMTRKLIPAFVHKLETYRNGLCELEYHENEVEGHAIKSPYPADVV